MITAPTEIESPDETAELRRFAEENGYDYLLESGDPLHLDALRTLYRSRLAAPQAQGEPVTADGAGVPVETPPPPVCGEQTTEPPEELPEPEPASSERGPDVEPPNPEPDPKGEPNRPRPDDPGHPSPAFQFYPDEWLASTKVALMTLSEQGAYVRLLCHAWNQPDCGLPDDDEALSLLSGMGEEWLKGGSKKLRKCFVVRDKKLFNLRLLKERDKQELWRQKGREGGLLSAEMRRRKKLEKQGSSRPKGGSFRKAKQPPESRPASRERNINEGSGNLAVCSLHIKHSRGVNDPHNLFEEFWTLYPRKVGKAAALKAFEKKAVDQATAQEVVDGLRAHLPELKACELRYVPHPTTWLHQERWADPVQPQPEAGKDSGDYPVWEGTQ